MNTNFVKASALVAAVLLFFVLAFNASTDVVSISISYDKVEGVDYQDVHFRGAEPKCSIKLEQNGWLPSDLRNCSIFQKGDSVKVKTELSKNKLGQQFSTKTVI